MAKAIASDGEEDRSKAMKQYEEAQASYSSVNKSAGGSYYDYRDLEANRSARPGFDRGDYYAFRPGEAIPTNQKRIIKMCMDAYDKVGIVRNVIDLMGDFGSQGINLVHENKSVETFYQQWFKKIDGKERSERFLNYLYRVGNVVIYRSSAKVTPAINKYIRSIATDLKIEVPDIEKNVIPWRYSFFNPLTLEAKNGELNIFLGRQQTLEVSSNSFFDNLQSGDAPAKLLDILPKDLRTQIKDGKKKIPLDPSKLYIAYYKKDDWSAWANPMTYAILDDIVMLEKMKLADLSALDGAISNIRLWTLGDFEHKVLPTRAGINKLRDILASNVGGGTMELVWGPELKYTESNSQVYKFLGPEKYQSVLNSIYAGLGVPPTLTGMANNGGGFTNNFISLKTMVERLQYGRDQLVKFWEKEIEVIRKAMGFRKPAHVVFNQMSLSDEAAEKALLIQLVDRDLISNETLLERFKEIPGVEKMRIRREEKERDNQEIPDKVGPYHMSQEEIDLQQTKLDQSAQNGRPANKKDSGPRKKRVDKPRSKPGLAELAIWSNKAYEVISENATKAYLALNKKANLRQLTKAQIAELERLKLIALFSLEPMTEVTKSAVCEAFKSDTSIPQEFSSYMLRHKISTTNMPIDDYRRTVLGGFVEYIART